MTTEFDDIVFVAKGDEAALMKVLELNHQENPLAVLSWPKVEGIVKRGVNQDLALIGLIKGPTGTIEATAGLLISQWWFSEDFHLEELWVYVVPEYRRSTHARHLYRWCKYLADQMQMPVVNGVMTLTKMRPKVRLAQREMPQVGAVFMYGRVIADAYNQRTPEDFTGD